ncbi:MAG: hypothetical protein WDO69_28210 [Pseudomonadota bacterium]
MSLTTGGCRQVLGLGDYVEVAAGGAGGGADTCDTCAPTECVKFDSSRLTLLGPDGTRPALPAGTGAGGDMPAVIPSAGAAGQPAVNPCSELDNPVFVAGSSAAKPFLQQFGENLAATGEMTLVYQSAGSCVGVDAVVNDTPIPGKATYWAATGEERSCSLEAQGTAVDLGISDVFATTCPELGFLPELPAGVTDDLGPVQTMGFVVPASSQETAISADAAYFVYGFGDGSGVEPWTDETAILQRTSASGTQSLIASVIGVPPTKFHGVTNSASADLLAQLVSLGRDEDTAVKAIGILVAGDADQNRSQVRLLPFQDAGESCGYYPDSSPTSLDKQNVRDGHYPIWGPLHFLTRQPNSKTQRLLSYLTGTATITGLDLIQVYVQSRVLPRCAMRVTRSTDGGHLTPYAPANPCGCYFEQQATGATRCQACTASSECPESAATCSKGFCER